MKEELKKTLEGMVVELFGDVEMRWVEAYFPFTEPSIELEIFFNVRRSTTLLTAWDNAVFIICLCTS